LALVTKFLPALGDWPPEFCSLTQWTRVPPSFTVEYPAHTGPLSIKCTLEGEETCETEDGQTFVVNANDYLVLNESERYAFCIDSLADVESFCIFYRLGLAEEVVSALNLSAETLLEDPTLRIDQHIQFFQKLYPHGNMVTPQVQKFRSPIAENGAAEAELEEHYHLLVESLLHNQIAIR